MRASPLSRNRDLKPESNLRLDENVHVLTRQQLYMEIHHVNDALAGLWYHVRELEKHDVGIQSVFVPKVAPVLRRRREQTMTTHYVFMFDKLTYQVTGTPGSLQNPPRKNNAPQFDSFIYLTCLAVSNPTP